MLRFYERKKWQEEAIEKPWRLRVVVAKLGLEEPIHVGQADFAFCFCLNPYLFSFSLFWVV